MCTTTNFITLSNKHNPCPTCRGSVQGRSDKIFCSIKCKNEHHRAARMYVKSRYDFISKGIQRNLIVMEGILGPNATNMEIHKDALFKRGFNSSLNNSVTMKTGKLWYELGNFSYRVTKEGTILVKRMTKFSEDMPVFFNRWLIDFPDDLDVNSTTNTRGMIINRTRLSRWDE